MTVGILCDVAASFEVSPEGLQQSVKEQYAGVADLVKAEKRRKFSVVAGGGDG